VLTARLLLLRRGRLCWSHRWPFAVRMDDVAGHPAVPSPYSPCAIDRWLKEWPLLESLSETPWSSRHLLHHECRNSTHSCASMPVDGRARDRRRPPSMMYTDILADLEQAQAQLPPSLGQRAIEHRRRTGATLGNTARALRSRYDHVRTAYWSALEQMAAGLGYEEPGSAPP
jgi:hypothetical protein